MRDAGYGKFSQRSIKRAALSHLTALIMMGFSVKALYKWATRSDLTVRIMTS